MNILALLGAVLFVFGLLILFNEDLLRWLVGGAFLVGGGYLLGWGFGLLDT